ncbi:hypothetical protein BFP76_14040 [Amylibacter kogurei]|uniref:Glutamine amidotransferase domain-containing protein n=1 Tax=Paramylibacter kogurei TaxID=1889778 RepID=A0A2G5K955_9RHOB|nr:hypothetical protein [Amylibacter kogurei]PIB26076.1 hypothetical protein BFP76_14040 [Amylibacter kogurei]
MDSSIVFSPLIPEFMLMIGAIVLICATGFAAWRGLSGWFLRALAGGVILCALANPVIRHEERDPLTDIVFLIEDASESQKISDRPEQVATALAGLREKIGNLENFELREVRVENDITQDETGSLVLTALANAASKVAQNRIAGAIVITDGRIHDAEVLPDFPAPVHVLQTGKSTDWDRRIVVTNAPAFAIVDEEITLNLRIENDGAVPAGKSDLANLTITIDGEVQSQFQVRTDADLDLPITLSHGGMNVLQFTITADETELTDRNNSAVVTINGVRDRLRVLLVSGEPYAGGRTWRNLLKSDSAVDLVHFTILRSAEKSNNVPVRELSLIAFPTRELFLDKIDDFDLIIFDKYRRRGMLLPAYLRNVVEYTKNGGAVLFATGPDFAGVNSLFRSDIAEILPAVPSFDVINQGYKPEISETGRRHPVTEGLDQWAGDVSPDDDPSWGRWFRLLDTSVRSGHMVMHGFDDKPLLVLDRVGEGRVAMLMSDQAWLWSRGFEGGGPQLELLRRLAHWMMKEPELEEEQLSAQVDGQQVFITRRSLSETIQAPDITYPDGHTETLELRETSPGRWATQLNAEQNGLFELSDGELKTVFAVGPAAPIEFEKTIADASLLRPLILETGAGVIRAQEIPVPNLRLIRAGRSGAGENWFGLTPRNAYLTLDVRQTPMLPGWVWLLMAATLIVWAWRREGR